MRKQLELWPPQPHRVPKSPVWASLNDEERRTLVAALARVMIKAAYPKQLAESGEDDNEQ